eukprot:CAMPEP_0117519842 /NCGR_PEP_ID=MMETSP0784-20121206/32861_1 /TAXON_ID=39447 /ORGANISM="" /LENGTH=201 /DNA_ID=CAMNT_0005315817 /DNA_START=65 /DNA_END=670 /DNA_ORIENTATION=-
MAHAGLDGQQRLWASGSATDAENCEGRAGATKFPRSSPSAWSENLEMSPCRPAPRSLGRRARIAATERLLEACRVGLVAEAEEALAAGAAAGLAAGGGETPLHLAVTIRDPQVAVTLAQVLLNAGADVNASDARSNTPLHLAVMLPGRGKCVPWLAKLLLAWKADPDARNQDRETPMEIARRFHMEAIVAWMQGKRVLQVA